MFQERAGDVGAVAGTPAGIAEDGEAWTSVRKIERARNLHIEQGLR